MTEPGPTDSHLRDHQPQLGQLLLDLPRAPAQLQLGASRTAGVSPEDRSTGLPISDGPAWRLIGPHCTCGLQPCARAACTSSLTRARNVAGAGRSSSAVLCTTPPG